MNLNSVASYNYLTNLTEENAKHAEDVDYEVTQWQLEQEKEAVKFYQHSSEFKDPVVKRMLHLAGAHPSAVPDNKEKLREMGHLRTTLEGIYGNAVVEKDGKAYLLEPDLTKILAESRDYDELLWAWLGWRNATGPKMRPLYTRFIDINKEAALQKGYTDMAQVWQLSNYDEDDIDEVVDALWEQMKPFYQQLHAFVRRRLIQQYPQADIKADGPIPAHLLGNMWAQQWNNILDLVTPFPDVQAVDATEEMKKQGYTPLRMFKTSESFFTSIGLEPMTDKFWEKSMITRPQDTPVQCHGAAFDFYKDDDFRIKMCTEVNLEDLQTVHHEMGHIEYFMQYRHQPAIFREGANSAFHEAVGDTIALSVMTPAHLEAIGLLKVTDTDASNNHKQELNFLMRMALEKVAFLPFGYLIDKWRWDLFRGRITEENYNAKWWEYRRQYQGVEAPVPRSEEDFDPGAKYHVPADVPYIRYFLSFIGQFQFQKALCDAKGHQGALDKCDIYKSKEAGEKLKSVLSLGASKPWREAMRIFTGQNEFRASAIKEYFQPLMDWLQEQNKDEHIGWK